MRSGLARSTLGIAMRSGGAGFDAYAVAGLKPPLVADFGEEYYRKAGAATTFSGLITHARASDATMINSSGALVTVSSNVPRVGHHVWNGSAWVNAGLRHESEARTQLLHTTDTLVTQSHTVTAVPHTLHFTGTGTVTLSGASTAGPLVGTGTGENNRVSLTFTPSAASLTLTVSGTVSNAQLEVGSTPSSYIPNLAGSGTVTRAAETLTIPAANLPWPSVTYTSDELGFSEVSIDEFSAHDSVDITDLGDRFRITRNANSGATIQVQLDAAAGQLSTGDLVEVEFEIVAIGASNNAYSGATNGGATSFIGMSYSSGPVVRNNLGVATGAGTGGIRFQLSVSRGANPASSVEGDWIEVSKTFSVRKANPLAVSMQMQGRMTYADTDESVAIQFFRWRVDASNFIYAYTATNFGGGTGDLTFEQKSANVGDIAQTANDYFSPGVLSPFNIASRHGSTFINGAEGGSALTEDTTPTSLPGLSGTDFELGYDFMGTIDKFRMWDADLADAGIEEAST